MEPLEIRESEITEFLFTNLIKLGYTLGEDELDDLAYLFFEFLVIKGILEDVEEE